MLNGLYGITNDEMFHKNKNAISMIESALKGGMKILQYRNKSNYLSIDKQILVVGEIKILCHKYQALLIINDDIELALNIEADGFHLGQSDISIDRARKYLGEYAIIGVTCGNSLDIAKKSVAAGANYIAFGSFYPSKTKPNAPKVVLDVLKKALNQFQVPIVAIGGITVDNAKPLVNAGANMIAVIHDLFNTSDIETQAQKFTKLFNLR